jgi:hypothetical protein
VLQVPSVFCQLALGQEIVPKQVVIHPAKILHCPQLMGLQVDLWRQDPVPPVPGLVNPKSGAVGVDVCHSMPQDGNGCHRE